MLQLFKNQTGAFSDDSDFEDPLFKGKTSKEQCKEKDGMQNINTKSKKRRQELHGFLEVEAEESDDGASSDEREGQDDYYEASFVNDATEHTQAIDNNMRAIYLESVKSPVAGRWGYKLQYEWKKHDDDNMIFSQALPLSQLEDEYEEDSFCVNSDAETESPSEETPPRKRGKKKAVKSGKCKKIKGKQRIRMIHSSSSEEDEQDLPMTQQFSAAPHGGRILDSSCSDEEEFGGKQTKSISNKSNTKTETKPHLTKLRGDTESGRSVEKENVDNLVVLDADMFDGSLWEEDLPNDFPNVPQCGGDKARGQSVRGKVNSKQSRHLLPGISGARNDQEVSLRRQKNKQNVFKQNLIKDHRNGFGVLGVSQSDDFIEDNTKRGSSNWLQAKRKRP